jgi:hypothetical protein
MNRKTAADHEGITRCGCGSKYWDDQRDTDGKLIIVCHECKTRLGQSSA